MEKGTVTIGLHYTESMDTLYVVDVTTRYPIFSVTPAAKMGAPVKDGDQLIRWLSIHFREEINAAINKFELRKKQLI